MNTSVQVKLRASDPVASITDKAILHARKMAQYSANRYRYLRSQLIYGSAASRGAGAWKQNQRTTVQGILYDHAARQMQASVASSLVNGSRGSESNGY